MVTISRSLNLVTTPCPMNFALVKQALDSMPAGDCLEVRLEAGNVGADVVDSLSGLGYDIVSVDSRSEDCIKVVVRRRSLSSQSVRPRRTGGCTKGRRGRS